MKKKYLISKLEIHINPETFFEGISFLYLDTELPRTSETPFIEVRVVCF